MSDSVYVKIFAGKEGVEIAQDVDCGYEDLWTYVLMEILATTEV